MRSRTGPLPLLAVGLLALACGPRTVEAPVEPAPPAMSMIAGKPAELCDPSASAAWNVRIDGGPAGVSRAGCTGRDAHGYHFVGQFVPEGASAPAEEFHLWLGSSGEPRQAELRTPDVVTHFRWTPEGLVRTVHGDSANLRRSQTPAWVAPLHHVFVRELMVRLGSGWSDRDASLTQSLYVPAPESLREQRLAVVRTAATLELSGPFRARFEGTALATASLMTAEDAEGGAKVEYARAAAGGPLQSAMPAVPLPTYALAEDLEALPVAIPGGTADPVLAGELVVRRARGPGRAPGIVFVSGSGPQDRLGFVPGTGIDVGSHELHDALARAGFVVLRWDDRGVGESTAGSLMNPGYLALVSDARRVVEYLASRPEVDPRRLFVIGHSEGASTAAILGAERIKVGKRRDPLAGIVMIAGTGRNLREVIYSQIRTVYDLPAAEIEALIAKAKQVHDAIERDLEVPAEYEAARPWLKEQFAQDPLANLRRVKVPVLLVQGEKDFQVDPQLDFAPLSQLLSSGRAGGRGSAAVLLPGLDHLLKPEPGVSKVGHYSDRTRKVAPAAIEHVVGWLSARARPPARTP